MAVFLASLSLLFDKQSVEIFKKISYGAILYVFIGCRRDDHEINI